MEKFTKVLRGYDPLEVNAFLDKIINQVEVMVNENKEKDNQIKDLLKMQQDYLVLKDKVVSFQNMEDTLKRAILMAEKTSEQIKLTAHEEREIIVNDAKKNASRIVNEALIKAEGIEKEADMLKRNVKIFKKRLKEIIETQLELVDDIEKIDL
ncbi:MAG: DivIVA domain-containing protein [Bacilli bacterium]